MNNHYELKQEFRTTTQSFGIHYSDIPTQDPFIAEAVYEALKDRADYPVCAETIAQMTAQIIAELDFVLQKSCLRNGERW